MTNPNNEIVITGLGAVSPLGIGVETFFDALLASHSGVRRLESANAAPPSLAIGGEVADFDPTPYVRPRKSLKVMSREIQFAYIAADEAFRAAGLADGGVDPERLGVVFGTDMMICDLDEIAAAYRSCLSEGRFDFNRWGQQALAEIHPLWMLKYLPNMPASHVAIACDARGPNNSITLGEVSSLMALSEAARMIDRGCADVMVCGGASSWIHPLKRLHASGWQLSQRCDDPAAACRPFDADRDGQVLGEGAAALVLERADHAHRRGARVLARVLAHASCFEPPTRDAGRSGSGTRRALAQVLQSAHLTPADVGHLNAHGLGTACDDAVEAAAIADVMGAVPVTALKSYFGNLGAAAGALEAVVSVMALVRSSVPPTRNYCRPDPDCPINVIRGAPLDDAAPRALLINRARTGQTATVALAGPE